MNTNQRESKRSRSGRVFYLAGELAFGFRFVFIRVHSWFINRCPLAALCARRSGSVVMRLCFYASLLATSIALAPLALLHSAAAADSESANPQYFINSIRPIFKEYCLRCHSTEKQKGDLDLERFSALSEVLRQPKVWLAMAEQLANNEMPPKLGAR